MLEFIVMVGISGSGKTTAAYEVAKTNNAIVISSDDIRETLLGDVNDQTQNARVFAKMYSEARIWLENGRNVVYDATNLNAKKRKALIRKLREDIGEVYCKAIIVCTTPDECHKRNAERDRVVPKEVIDRQLASFQVPSYLEGFNNIEIYTSESEEICTKYLNKLFAKARLMKHDNPHHNDTVSEHCVKVSLSMTGYDNRPKYNSMHVVAWTGFYHDIGKVLTKTYDDKGIAHFYNHDNVSSYLILLNNNARYLMTKELLEASFAIGNHMKHFSYKDVRKFNAWLSSLPPKTEELLKLLIKADMKNCVEEVN